MYNVRLTLAQNIEQSAKERGYQHFYADGDHELMETGIDKEASGYLTDLLDIREEAKELWLYNQEQTNSPNAEE